MKICPECGRTLHEGFQICPSDGAKLAAPTQILRGGAPVVSTSNLRKSASLSHTPPAWQIGLMVALVVLLGAAIYLCVNKAISDGHPKVVTIDELIEQKDYSRAVAILEHLKDEQRATRADKEKLDGLLIEMAAVALSEKNSSDTVKWLDKIDAKSPRYQEAQRLIARCKTHGGIGFNSHSSGPLKQVR